MALLSGLRAKPLRGVAGVLGVEAQLFKPHINIVCGKDIGGGRHTVNNSTLSIDIV